MFGSFGSSYSSVSSGCSQPINISTGTKSDYSCAYPSWPTGPSLARSPDETRATSFLSDDDLFPCDSFEDDAHSVSSSLGSNSADSPFVPEEEMMQMRRQQQMAMQREALQYIVLEKERRRKAAKKARAGGSGSSAKKSPKSKLQSMTPITEACE